MADPVESSSPFSPYRSDGKLYGFVCVVTGVTQPIGKAIVEELVAHGAACVYACHPPTESFTSAATIPQNGVNDNEPDPKIIPYPMSFSSESDSLALIDDILNAWGRLDVWVSTSALLGPPSIDRTTPTDLQRAWESNSLAPFLALKYAPPAMGKKCEKRNYAHASEKDRAYGSIIVVGSVVNEQSGVGGPCFTMSANSALGLVRAGVVALKGTGVRINCISPGQIDGGVDLKSADMQGMTARESQKDHIGLGRAGTPTEVARVAGFLASGFSSYMTGANLVVDGGASAMSLSNFSM